MAIKRFKIQNIFRRTKGKDDLKEKLLSDDIGMIFGEIAVYQPMEDDGTDTSLYVLNGEGTDLIPFYSGKKVESLSAQALEDAKVYTNEKTENISGINDLKDKVSANTNSISALTESVAGLGIDISDSETTQGSLRTYIIKQGDNVKGKIEIPNDVYVTAGSVVQGVWADGSFTESAGADLALKLSRKDGTAVFVDVSKLISSGGEDPDIAALKETVNGHTKSIAEVEKQLDGIDTVTGAIATVKSEIIGEADTDFNTLKKTEDRIKEVKAVATANTESIKTLSGKVDVDKVSTAIEAAKTDLIDSAITYNTIGKLEEVVISQGAAIGQNSDNISQLQTNYNTIEGEVDGLVGGNTLINESINQLSGDVATIKSTQTATTESVNTNSTRITEINNSLTALTESYNQFKSDTEAKSTGTTEQIKTLNEKVTELTDSVGTINTTLSTTTETANSAKSTAEATVSVANSANTTATDAKKKADANEESIKFITGATSSLKVTLDGNTIKQGGATVGTITVDIPADKYVKSGKVLSGIWGQDGGFTEGSGTDKAIKLEIENGSSVYIDITSISGGQGSETKEYNPGDGILINGSYISIDSTWDGWSGITKTVKVDNALNAENAKTAETATNATNAENAQTAEKASKLGEMDLGNQFKGIYLESGIPKAMMYGLNVEVGGTDDNAGDYQDGDRIAILRGTKIMYTDSINGGSF